MMMEQAVWTRESGELDCYVGVKQRGLPAGVVRVEGTFGRGDAVVLRGPDGADLGRGLVAYDAGHASQIAGRSSRAIAAILGYAGRAEMVHRDDMALAAE
jgi:glutamate 5-kinase